MAIAEAGEMVALLRSIDSKLSQLLSRAPAGGNGPALADDRDLDSQYGDPEVKFNPRDWHGDNCKGRRMSQCPAEFLDLLAGTFDYFAKKADENGETTNAGKPVAPYKRRDAARARGWAARKRTGWKGATVDTATGEIHESAGDFAAGDPFAESSEWPTDGDSPF
jgi:hypothetical protein